MTPKERPGLASLIIPCWNQLAYTRQCLAVLVRHTRPPWELIVVDNGSTDDTAAYLAGVQDSAAVPVTVIANTSNRGFPAAVNQGLKVARGEYLVLLNNDVLVTEGWLGQLIGLANASPCRTDCQSVPHTLVDRGQLGGEALPSPPLAPSGLPLPSSPPTGEESFASGQNICSYPATIAQPSQTSEKIGLVGPMSNYAAPPQLVEHVPYRDLDEMPAFARRWRDEHRGKWFTVRKLSGFCVLIKRVVYETVGGLDERFGLGMFDDDDLAERARRAGFSLAVAQDLFVHHFGSRTFTGNGIDAEKLLDENARRFAAKWGRATPEGRRVALEPWSDRPAFLADSQREFARQVDAAARPTTEPPSTGSSQVPPHHNGAPAATQPASDPLRSHNQAPAVRQLKISLTMIVRDEEQNLPHVLGSVASLFDEIVVVDTGSADRTKEIAREFGAKVFDFAWIDDFAAARNESLARATGDYAFWLDADDVLDPPEREKLRALLDRMEAGDAAGYVVRCACEPAPDGTGGETVVDHVRLFPLRENVRWTYRVHEQIVRRQRGESAEAEGCWRRILGLTRPEQFCSLDQGIYGHRTRRNLAVLAAERGDHAEAAKLWAEVLAECPGDREAQTALERLKPVLPGQ